ncbi:M1 family metallopeptidase [Vitiosangium sp. GDMCC 1.1324]|uniref:M1 family metallopeptidase n=1 Tax=Vitiosangium sp. (strain GDMCC 1.1324) TaxID=2138576 RepID=UPI000D3707A6|nr:M1 family metallopeptidase [Vitiosangium sp. GDMCC 1.1324]PTL84759.1 peptidase M1 [Vitiosangium sp. GDMCC 1.1324]
MRWPLIVLVALVSLRCTHAPEAPAATPAPAPVAATPDWPEPQPPTLRLPDSVRPARYALDLTLLPAEPTYAGTVTIDVEVREPVRQVWLHAQDLQVTYAGVLAGGRTLEAKTVTASEGRLGLLLPETLGAGTYQLTLAFIGRADRERSQGIYAVEEGGESYLYTFFEPIDARRAFPCFDEPGFKVPWRLRFTVKQEHVALANHAIVSEEPLPGGLKRITFAESRPMPSYLVAFVVGPFDLVDGGPIGRAHVPLRFIVPHGRGAETAYAASVTPRIITLLEDFFDQTYPYEKLDVAVVPRYWGTMEHPGIVALGQPLTLIRPGEETVQRRKSYANIAIHELGHYWFGDVVTCRWWDDIWLNESLTSWLDQKITDRFDPAWSFALEGQARSAAFAFEMDSLTATPPVRKPIATNDDIVGSFDNGTTYAKGASLLSMLEGWLGDERVRDMLRIHVRKHAWQVATSDDLLSTMSESLGPDAARVFRGYIDQPGVPRVSAELQCKAGTAPRLKLSQERFLPAGSTGTTTQTWSIPVCVRAGKGKDSTRACTVLTSATGEMELPLQGCPSWLLLNAGGTGYYRVGYSREQLAGLLSTPQGTLTTPERLAFLADVKAAVERGDVPLGEALKLVPATTTDSNRLILQRGAEFLSSIHPELLPEADRERYRAWIRDLYGPRARALGWTPKPGEGDDVKQLRSLVVGRAAFAGDPALNQEAARLARAWLADRKSVNPEVVWMAMQVAARGGDRALFDTVLAQARAAKDRNERSRLLAMLGAFRDPALVKEALALVAGDEFDVRETRSILGVTFFTPESRAQAWDFYKQHFDTLAGKLRSDELNGIIAMVGDLCDEQRRTEAEALLSPRVAKIEGGPRSLSRALESIRLCIESERRNQPGVLEFLRTRGKAVSKTAPR